jgi:8-oxo-dGTP pyrophosphatase MutT (NUDIX family)
VGRARFVTEGSIASSPGSDLPHLRRATARVLLVDADDRVLLMHDHDANVPGATFWVTPGGGLDPGETSVDAAAREVREETGLALDPGGLGRPAIVRTVRHTFSDIVTEQAEAIYLARVEAFTPDDSGFTDSERTTVLGARWWSPAELAATSEDVWPRGLAALLPRLLAGEDGIDLGFSDEDPRGPSPGAS